MSGETPLPGSQAASSCCLHRERGERGLPGVSMIRTLIPSRGFYPHNLVTAPTYELGCGHPGRAQIFSHPILQIRKLCLGEMSKFVQRVMSD